VKIYENDIRKLCEQIIEFSSDNVIEDLAQQVIGISDMWFELLNNLYDQNISLRRINKDLNDEIFDLGDDLEDLESLESKINKKR